MRQVAPPPPKFRRANLHGYQVRAVEHGLAHPEAMFWLDLGLGKTAVGLTIINDRMDRLEVYGTLVTAPLWVCQTVWAQQAMEWAHTQHLTFSLIHGDVVTRHRAMRVKADVYLVNYENIPWLVDELIAVYLSKGKYLPFNQVIYDEVTKMKNATSKRDTAMADLLPFVPYRFGLTGEPAPNGYKDLHGQFLMVDAGKRLGIDKKDYTDQFFRKAGYMDKDVELVENGAARVHQRIADITLQMSNEDYLELPPVMVNDIMLDMPPDARDQYEQLESELFMELDSGIEVEVFNQAALYNKCLQAANGALYYDEDHRWDVLHDIKLDALETILEEAGGNPVLLMYQYQHDLARIQKRFPYARSFGDVKTAAQAKDFIRQWDAGKIPLAAGHPASMAYGLNLQYGGHIATWFGLNWSLDLTNQANGRLARQGQKHPVMINRLLINGTLDLLVRERLAGKCETQRGLKEALNEYRNSKRGCPREGATVYPGRVA